MTQQHKNQVFKTHQQHTANEIN